HARLEAPHRTRDDPDQHAAEHHAEHDALRREPDRRAHARTPAPRPDLCSCSGRFLIAPPAHASRTPPSADLDHPAPRTLIMMNDFLAHRTREWRRPGRARDR